MKISVVVTTYNRPDALEKVIEALQNQKSHPHEILVADDGSGPETRDLVEECRKRSSIPLVHVWQKDKGFRLSRSRNRAVLAASGDYILFLDGDCVPDIHFVGDHGALAREGWFFQGKRILVNEGAETDFHFSQANSLVSRLAMALKGKIDNAHHIFRIPFFPVMEKKKLSGIRSCNMGMFKSDIMAVNGFNNAFQGWGREDSEFVSRLMAYGVRRQEHPFKAICYHLWHPENSRENLERNDEILAETLAAKRHWCDDGITHIQGS